MEIFGSEEVASRDFHTLSEQMTGRIDGLRKDSEKAATYEERNELDKKIYAYERIIEEAEVFLEHTDRA